MSKQQITIGGNRVGSGKKMHTSIDNYGRSTHNLNEKWASSMSSGVLYPCLCKLGMRGDSFDISLNADARTIPTKGPLFGSYKMQIDIYQCPIRLYQGILHNNPLSIGLKMNQVLFPKINIRTICSKGLDLWSPAMNKSSLAKYLGLSGIGKLPASIETESTAMRYINALPFLSYYDIYKTYYANKQEEVGYVITPGTIIENKPTINSIQAQYDDTFIKIGETTIAENNNMTPFFIKGENLTLDNVRMTIKFTDNESHQLPLVISNKTLAEIKARCIAQNISKSAVGIAGTPEKQSNNGVYSPTWWNVGVYWPEIADSYAWQIPDDCTIEYSFSVIESIPTYKSDIVLQSFPLTNIDDMRYDLLAHHELGTAFTIEQDGDGDYLPYSTITHFGNNSYSMNGLCIKTYQNDIFNNWLNTDWIEGENGINEITKVEVTDGSFSMDALNFAQKLYNMLNRIALAGATYEDWQDVVYEDVKRRQIESPIYCGGMSQEIMFDEIVQTAPAEGSPLGELGGRGRVVGQSKKGGKLHIKCDEACFIIGIISLTPRIFYTQGNEFYLTELESMDDLHKPAMDGIGFQDLIGERLAWWDTTVTNGGEVTHRSKVGKLPAWIDYMTSYDRAFGDFAEEYGKGYMILNRNYERDEETGGIKDATTYIDPAKYNYAFAYTNLDAQNFWVEIGFNIKARRLMSARIIPNV